MFMGIDPGPNSYAFVLWDGRAILSSGECSLSDDFPLSDTERPIAAVEDFVTYRPIAKEGRETIKMIGSLRVLFGAFHLQWVEIPRADVLRHLTGGTKGGDTALRQAIYDRFGGSRRAAVGTKKEPGPLYGLAGSHKFAALAVAITAQDTIKQERK